MWKLTSNPRWIWKPSPSHLVKKNDLNFFWGNVLMFNWIHLNFIKFLIASEWHQEAYSESRQKSKMKLFAEIVNSLQPLTIVAKSSVLDIWQGSSECAFSISNWSIKMRSFCWQRRRSIAFIVNFEHISHLFLVSPVVTLSK